MVGCAITTGPERRGAFTLVEGLLVVTLIGLLFSLMAPTVCRSRERARLAGCAQQLKQLGQATQLYSAEFDGFCLPYWMAWQDSAEASWFDALLVLGYLPDGGRAGAYVDCRTLVCAANPNWYAMSSAGNTGVNYAMNQGLTRDFAAGYVFRYYRLGQVARPERKVVIGEPAAEPAWGTGRCDYSLISYQAASGGSGYYHGGRTNAVYVDGHVEALTEGEMAPPCGRPWWYRYAARCE